MVVCQSQSCNHLQIFLIYSRDPVRQLIVERDPDKMPIHSRNRLGSLAFEWSLKEKKKIKRWNLCCNHEYTKCHDKILLEIYSILHWIKMNFSKIILVLETLQLIKSSSWNALSTAICQWTSFACLSKFQSHKSVSFSAK